jgi:outer membrane lipoprotein SlyB
MRKLLLFIIPAMLLTGCASLTGWHPIVNTAVEKHPETMSVDFGECKGLASKASSMFTEGLGGAVAGSAVAAGSGAWRELCCSRFKL